MNRFMNLVHTDIDKWCDAVQAHALKYGYYKFTLDERKTIVPYLRGSSVFHAARYLRGLVTCNFHTTMHIVAQVRHGVVQSVAAKLQGLTR